MSSYFFLENINFPSIFSCGFLVECAGTVLFFCFPEPPWACLPTNGQGILKPSLSIPEFFFLKSVQVTLWFTNRYIPNPFFDLDFRRPLARWMLSAAKQTPTWTPLPGLPPHRLPPSLAATSMTHLRWALLVFQCIVPLTFLLLPANDQGPSSVLIFRSFVSMRIKHSLFFFSRPSGHAQDLCAYISPTPFNHVLSINHKTRLSLSNRKAHTTNLPNSPPY